MEIILMILFLTIAIVLLLACAIAYYFLAEKNRRDWTAFYNTTDFDRLRALLDDIIKDQLNIYKSMHPEYSQAGAWIKVDDQKKIITQVATSTYLSLTDAIKNQLSIVYKFNNDDELINIIGNKVASYIINWTAEVNSRVDISEDLSKLENT